MQVRLDPPDAAKNAYWLTATSWQDGGLVVNRLKKVGDGVYKTTTPIPISGDWKSTIRLHTGRQILGAPVYMPEDAAIPAKEIPATPQFSRPFITDKKLLQREVKQDVAGWLWTAASLIVLILYAVFLTANAWGVARVSRLDPRRPPSAPPERERQRVTATPAGAAS
jgi:hypothetical protein